MGRQFNLFAFAASSRVTGWIMYKFFYTVMCIMSVLFLNPRPPIFRLLILGVIELCWNTYPSTVVSSISLHICHAALLVALWFAEPLFSESKSQESKAE